jgi:hypothetical protein
MEKLILYLVLAVLIYVWVLLYQGAGGLQGLMIILSIGSVAIATRCPKSREGR